MTRTHLHVGLLRNGLAWHLRETRYWTYWIMQTKVSLYSFRNLTVFPTVCWKYNKNGRMPGSSVRRSTQKTKRESTIRTVSKEGLALANKECSLLPLGLDCLYEIFIDNPTELGQLLLGWRIGRGGFGKGRPSRVSCRNGHRSSWRLGFSYHSLLWEWSRMTWTLGCSERTSWRLGFTERRSWRFGFS